MGSSLEPAWIPLVQGKPKLQTDSLRKKKVNLGLEQTDKHAENNKKETARMPTNLVFIVQLCSRAQRSSAAQS